MSNLANLLKAQAGQRPAQIAMIDGRAGRERSITFQRLEELSAATAETLAQSGIKAGSRAIVLVPMRIELYVTLAALWRLGATALFMDPSSGIRHIARCCQMASPDAMIGMPKARLLTWVSGDLRSVSRKLYWGRQLRLDAQPSQELTIQPVGPEHPAILTFTSGSTGQPKGAIRTHHLLKAQYDALVKAIELEAGECDLATMPVFALVNLAAGLTTLIPDANLRRPGFILPKPVIKQIHHWKPSRCTASPTFFLRLCEEAEKQRTTLPHFRKIYTGGAPVFPRSLRFYSQSFTSASINVIYGSTEAEPISHIELNKISKSDLKRMREGKGLLVGKISPETRLRIIRDHWGEALTHISQADFAAMELSPFETGEIVVSGDHVIPGYLNGIGDAENKIRIETQIWHRTGDAGYLDREGRLWLCGRCSAKFVVDRATVYPFSIECAAVEYFDIHIAACLKQKSGYILVLPEKQSPNYIQQFAPKLPAPRKTIILRNIPVDKRHNAKIDYPKLEKRSRALI